MQLSVLRPSVKLLVFEELFLFTFRYAERLESFPKIRNRNFRWMKHILSEKTIDRFVKYGVNVFGIDASLPKQEIAEKAIEATYRFFESIGIPMHLREVGIDESRIDQMAHHIAVNEGLENAYAPLTELDIKEILLESL